MINVLLVDDSPLARIVFRDIINATSDLRVTGEAANGQEAILLAEHLQPDLIIMDIMMPVMDGLKAIEAIMARNPRPILVLSATLADREVNMAFRAIKIGALDVLTKPSDTAGVLFAKTLVDKIRLLSRIKVIRHPRRLAPEPAPAAAQGSIRRDILAIGASTGGPKAVMSIIKTLPENFPGTVCIVQHIAAGFARGFAQWLDHESALRVRTANDGDEFIPGSVLVAPNDFHMSVSRGRIRLVSGPKVHQCRPAVDCLFKSLAMEMGDRVVGVLLTGMGKDGAEGLKIIADHGGATLVQDEETSVVFGMPKAAIALGAARQILPLSAMPDAIAAHFTHMEE